MKNLAKENKCVMCEKPCVGDYCKLCVMTFGLNIKKKVKVYNKL